MRSLRLSILSVAFAVTALIAALAWYDYYHIYLPLQRANTVQRTNPPLVWPHSERLNRMFRGTYGSTLAVHLAKEIEWQIHPDTHSAFEVFLSGLLLRLHTTPDEQLALVLNQGNWGNQTYGIASASVAVFAKPLPACSDYELATLVAMYRSPSAYTIGSDRLLHSAASILAKYDDGT